jgi:putative aldouronate transport system substrate-binding protein
VIGNQLINYLKPGQPDDLYSSWKEFNNEAKRSPLLGFVFDESSVKNEITQLTSVIGEYRAASTGAIPDPAKMLEERNEKLKKAGIEKVQTELQTQIDAWKAAQ